MPHFSLSVALLALHFAVPSIEEHHKFIIFTGQHSGSILSIYTTVEPLKYHHVFCVVRVNDNDIQTCS